MEMWTVLQLARVTCLNIRKNETDIKINRRYLEEKNGGDNIGHRKKQMEIRVMDKKCHCLSLFFQNNNSILQHDVTFHTIVPLKPHFANVKMRQNTTISSKMASDL